MVGRKVSIKVGDKFLLNCGVEVEVVEYRDSRNVLVKDSVGNAKTAKAEQIRNGCVRWAEFGVTTHQRERPEIKVGDSFVNKYGENYAILEVESYSKILVQFSDTLNKQYATKGNILDDVIRDTVKYNEQIASRKEVAKQKKIIRDSAKVLVGDRFETNLYGWIMVLEFDAENPAMISVIFEDTGNIKHGVYKSQAKSGHVKDCDLVEFRKQQKILSKAKEKEDAILKHKVYLESDEYKIFLSNRARENYLANREERIKAASNYQKDNLDRARVRNQNRRSRRKNAEGTHTLEEINAKFSNQNGKCIYCKSDLGNDKHLDHIIPLALCGTNYISNLQWLCPTCNLRKNARHPDLWAKIAEIEFNYKPISEEFVT